MNLVLIGYRGTGKSAVGAAVAARLRRELVSLDAEIVRRAGIGIPRIVAERGWPGFRDLEEQVVAEHAERDGLVIDCGGGVIEREANVERLRAGGRVFWLRAAVATIAARIGGDTQRPSLTGARSFVEEIAEVLERRAPRYRRAAHHLVDTDDRNVSDIADEIVRLFAPQPEAAWAGPDDQG